MRLLAFLTLFLISGCSVAPLKIAADACFSGSDVLRLNQLSLRLSPDGTYSAKLQGDIALWGTANGHWLDAGATIALTPELETGVERSFLRTLFKRSNGSLVAAAMPGQYDYRWEPLARHPCQP
jgi:hypothetical protein